MSKKIYKRDSMNRMQYIKRMLSTVGHLRKKTCFLPSNLIPNGGCPEIATFLFQTVDIRCGLKFSHSPRNMYLNL